MDHTPHEDTPHEELISAYLDGEVSGQEQERVEQLLDESQSARQLYEELLSVRTALQELPVRKLPGDLSPDIVAAVQKKMSAEPPSGGAVSPAASGSPVSPGDVLSPASLDTSRAPSDCAPAPSGRSFLRPLVYAAAAIAAAVLIMVVAGEQRQPELAEKNAARQTEQAAEPGTGQGEIGNVPAPQSAETAIAAGKSPPEGDGAGNPELPDAKAARDVRSPESKSPSQQLIANDDSAPESTASAAAPKTPNSAAQDTPLARLAAAGVESGRVALIHVHLDDRQSAEQAGVDLLEQHINWASPVQAMSVANELGFTSSETAGDASASAVSPPQVVLVQGPAAKVEALIEQYRKRVEAFRVEAVRVAQMSRLQALPSQPAPAQVATDTIKIGKPGAGDRSLIGSDEGGNSISIKIKTPKIQVGSPPSDQPQKNDLPEGAAHGPKKPTPPRPASDDEAAYAVMLNDLVDVGRLLTAAKQQEQQRLGESDSDAEPGFNEEALGEDAPGDDAPIEGKAVGDRATRPVRVLFVFH